MPQYIVYDLIEIDLDKKLIFRFISKNKIMENKCRDPGSNRGPLDLQSNALPTELSRQDKKQYNIYVNDKLSDAFSNKYLLKMNMFILKS